MYYRLWIDLDIPGRWHLSRICTADGEMFDTWYFFWGHRVDLIDGLVITTEVPGRPLDYSMIPLGAVPVVSQRLGKLLQELAPDDIQRIPAEVEADRNNNYEIINICASKAAIDEERSGIQWTVDEDDHSIRKPQMIWRLVIDPTKTDGAMIFRPSNWQVSMIVAEPIKKAMESRGIKKAGHGDRPASSV